MVHFQNKLVIVCEEQCEPSCFAIHDENLSKLTLRFSALFNFHLGTYTRPLVLILTVL